MLPISCAQLKTLSKRLLELNEARNRTILLPHSDVDQIRADDAVIRTQRLISSHRRRCPQCRMNEIVIHSGWKLNTSSNKAPQYPLQSL